MDYPFVARPDGRQTIGPADDVAAADNIRYLVADFFLSYDDPGEYDSSLPLVKPPLRIKYLYNVGCWADDRLAGGNAQNTGSATLDGGASQTPEDNIDGGAAASEYITQQIPPAFPTNLGDGADIVIVDAANRVVFDTTVGATARAEQDWGADYKIYTWSKAGHVCHLVAYTTWTTADNDRKHFAKYMAPANAVLDARATYKMPKRLRRLYVKNGTTTGPYTGITQFSNGYNTEIIAAAPSVNNFRVNTRVVFNVEPASGAGKYPNCGDVNTAIPITKINGIAPVQGGILISGADCVWPRRSVTVDSVTGAISADTTQQQQIGADCPPCCECTDYAATALYMNQVQSQYVLIGQRANDVKLLHEQNVARWLDQRECSTNPLKLFLVPQRCPYMDIVMMLCNPCQECIESSTLTVALSASVAEVMCGYTALFAPGINGRAVPINVNHVNDGTQLSAQFPLVRGGASAYLKFRVRFSVRDQYAITGILTGITQAGDPILTGCNTTPTADRSTATAERVEALFCTPEGTTELPC